MNSVHSWAMNLLHLDLGIEEKWKINRPPILFQNEKCSLWKTIPFPTILVLFVFVDPEQIKYEKYTNR